MYSTEGTPTTPSLTDQDAESLAHQFASLDALARAFDHALEDMRAVETALADTMIAIRAAGHIDPSDPKSTVNVIDVAVVAVIRARLTAKCVGDAWEKAGAELGS